MHRSENGFVTVVGVVIAAVLAVALIGGGVYVYAQTDPVTVTITDKESIPNNDAGHEYRVYTDQGTFVMKDSLVHPRFDTADEYGALEPGQTYDCEKYGFRIPLLSSFENLINCEGSQ